MPRPRDLVLNRVNVFLFMEEIGGCCTAKELAEEFGVSIFTASTRLRHYKKQKYVKRIGVGGGRGQNRGYVYILQSMGRKTLDYQLFLLSRATSTILG